MRCIRQRNVQEQHFQVMAYFGEMCAEDIDLPSFHTEDFLAASALYHEEAIRREEEQRQIPLVPGPQIPIPGGRISFRDLA